MFVSWFVWVWVIISVCPETFYLSFGSQVRQIDTYRFVWLNSSLKQIIGGLKKVMFIYIYIYMYKQNFIFEYIYIYLNPKILGFFQGREIFFI